MNKRYEVFLKVNGVLTRQVIDEDRLRKWHDRPDWKTAIDFALQYAYEECSHHTVPPNIEFDSIKEFHMLEELGEQYAYVHDCRTLQ